ncbi:CorA family divalent cation transporter [Paraburkholderia oxyphila]|uniref:CorA family divalent cation transporter n=1 Tax=Paraburkholderia oxyphila TaxID=614212 RepID=UPI000486C046|nr:CorA family divalent cation transporter [Paraburkholderia oxyphila]
MSAQPQLAQESDSLPLNRGYVFSANGVGHKINANEARERLMDLDSEAAGFVWLHFHNVPAVLSGWPTQLAKLPPGFGDTLREGLRSTRVEHVRQNLIAVVNDVDYDFERKGPIKVATLWISVGARCLLSVHSLPLRSVDQLSCEVEAGVAFSSPMALLVRLMQGQADLLFGIVRSATQTANEVEIALRTGTLPKRSSLGGIRRDLVHLRRLLAPEPAALFRLINRPPRWVRDEDVQSLRQSAEEFSLALRDMASLQERIQLLEEEIAAKVAEHTNRSVLILTAVTVIALPINLISGLLGMNIGGVPFRHTENGFSIVFLLSTVLTSLSAWLIFRKKHD